MVFRNRKCRNCLKRAWEINLDRPTVSMKVGSKGRTYVDAHFDSEKRDIVRWMGSPIGVTYIYLILWNTMHSLSFFSHIFATSKSCLPFKLYNLSLDWKVGKLLLVELFIVIFDNFQHVTLEFFLILAERHELSSLNHVSLGMVVLMIYWKPLSQ